jgi:mannonate dehydratase
MWANLEYSIRAITPVAEQEGIRLGIHPPKPSTDSHGGLFPVLNSYDGYRRLLDIADSPSNAIEFCQSSISEMTDSTNDAIYGFVDEMMRQDRILYVPRPFQSRIPRTFPRSSSTQATSICTVP